MFRIYNPGNEIVVAHQDGTVISTTKPENVTLSHPYGQEYFRLKYKSEGGDHELHPWIDASQLLDASGTVVGANYAAIETYLTDLLSSAGGGGGGLTTAQVDARINAIAVPQGSLTEVAGEITAIDGKPIAGGAGDVTQAELDAEKARIAALETSQTTQDTQLATVDLADNGDGTFEWTKPDGSTATLADNEIEYNAGALTGNAPAGKEIGIDTATDEIYYPASGTRAWTQSAGTPTSEILDSTIPPTDGEYATLGTLSVEKMDQWGVSRKVRRVFNASSVFDFTALGYADKTAIYVRNEDAKNGLGITYGSGGTTNREVTQSNGESAIVAGQDEFNLQPGEIAFMEKDGSTVYVSVIPGKRTFYFNDYALAAAANSITYDGLVVIRDKGEIWGRRTNQNAAPFPANGVPNDDWFKQGSADPQTLILNYIEVGIRSAGTNAGSNIEITLVDNDGNDYPDGDWVYSANLVQYAGGSATIITDKALYTGIIGVGRNKAGTVKFYYTGDFPNGLSAIRVDSNVATVTEAVAVTYQGTNYSDDFAAIGDIVDPLYWTTSGQDKATDQAAHIVELTEYTAGDVISFREPDNTDADYGTLFNWQVLTGQTIADTEVTDTSIEAELIAIKPKLERFGIGSTSSETVAYPGDLGAPEANKDNVYYLDETVGALPLPATNQEISISIVQANSTDAQAVKDAAKAKVTHYRSFDTGAGFIWVESESAATTETTEQFSYRQKFLGTSGNSWTITLPPNATLLPDHLGLGLNRVAIKHATGTKLGEIVQDTSGVNYNAAINPATLEVTVTNNLPEDVTDISIEFGVQVSSEDYEAWTDPQKADRLDFSIKSIVRNVITLFGHTINLGTFAVPHRSIQRVQNDHATNEAILHLDVAISDSKGNVKSVNQNSRHELIIPPGGGWVEFYKVTNSVSTTIVWVESEGQQATELEIVRYTADGPIEDKDHRAIFETGAVNMTLAASTENRLIQMVSEGPTTIITANGAEEFTSSGGTSTDQKLTLNATFQWATIIGRTAGGWSQYVGQVGLPAGVDESTPTKFKAGTRLVQNGVNVGSGTVTFPEAFKAGTTPTVMILPHAPGDNINATLQSVSETGFNAWIVRNENDVGMTKDIHWIAIGEKV